MTRKTTEVGTSTRTRVAAAAYLFLVLDTILLLLLVWAAYLRHIGWDWVGGLNDPLGGLVPLVVPWGGALGGVCASLFGVGEHGRDWDVTFNPWHFVRLPLGAATGTVAFLVVVVVLKTVGIGDAAGTAGTGTVPGAVDAAEAIESLPMTPGALGLYLIIAFVAGFQNKYFIDLLKKVAEVVFANGDVPKDGLSVTVTPDEIDFGEVEGGTRTAIVSVEVAGAKDLELSSDWYNHLAAPFSAQANSVKDALGQTHREIEVTYAAAPAPGEHVDRLVVTVGHVVREVRLRALTKER